MDLSKAFDCIDHNLLIAKLHAYGLSAGALGLIYDYLSNRKQRVKINDKFSSWHEKKGVPQGSVLGPLLFNAFVNDIFLFVDSQVCNCADDTTIFACHPEQNIILNQLEADMTVLSKWFCDNCMKLNDDKCHLIMFGNKTDDVSLNDGSDVEITESEKEKLLGVTFDKKLNFRTHINEVCKKAAQKLHALARLSNYMHFEQLKLLMNSFIKSQFSYCPIIWMFHDRTLNAKINKIH